MAFDGHGQRAGGLQVERAVGGVDGALEVFGRLAREALHHLHDVPFGQPGPGRGHAPVSCHHGFEQLVAALQVARRGAVHERDATEHERIAVELGHGQHQGALHQIVEQGLGAGGAQGIEQAALGLQQIVGVAREPLGPDHFATLVVGQLGHDDDLLAQGHVAATQHKGRVQPLADLFSGALASTKGGGGQAGDHAQVLTARELGDHAVGDQLADDELFARVAARFERHHGDRRAKVGRHPFGHPRAHRGRAVADGVEPPGAHRLRPVFEVALATVFHLGVDADHDAIEHARGDQGVAGRSQVGDARGEVHAVAVDVVLVRVQIGGVDAGAQVQLLALGQAAVDGGEVPVQRQRGPHGIGGVLEFNQQAVAQALDEAASACGQHLGGGMVHEAAPLAHDLGLVVGHEPYRFNQVHHQHDLVLLLGQRRHDHLLVCGKVWGANRLRALGHACGSLGILLQFLTALYRCHGCGAQKQQSRLGAGFAGTHGTMTVRCGRITSGVR